MPPSARATRWRFFPLSRAARPMIKVQTDDFDVGAELAALSRGRTEVGAVASFLGLGRDVAGPGELTPMTLEH